MPAASQGNAIAALVANVVGLVLCCLTSLPGLVLGIIALVQVRSSPRSSRICALIAWVLFGISVVIALVLLLTGFFGGFWEDVQEAYELERDRPAYEQELDQMQ